MSYLIVTQRELKELCKRSTNYRSKKVVSKPDKGGENDNDGEEMKILEAKYECSICKEKVRYGAFKS